MSASIARREEIILHQLVNNEAYHRKVLPHIQAEYFFEKEEKILFEIIRTFSEKYNAPAPIEAIDIAVSEMSGISAEEHAVLQEYSGSLLKAETIEEGLTERWLYDSAEEWCQEQAIHNALSRCIEIQQGLSKTESKDAIPDIMKDALGVSFDTSIGHDYEGDVEARYEKLREKNDKIAFDLDMFNKITDGGLENKSLNCCMAGCVHPDTKVTIRYRKRK